MTGQAHAKPTELPRRSRDRLRVVLPAPQGRHLPGTEGAVRQAYWLAGGLLMGFLLPFVFTDILEVNRDLYLGIYGLGVLVYVALWARRTGYGIVSALRRRWALAAVLGAGFAGLLALMIFRTQDATARPDGLELAAALAWRGVFYGAIDGLLLSVFPILAVFAAFAGSALRRGVAGTIAIGTAALVASLAMTLVYHLGYSELRNDRALQPVAGAAAWGAPTLLTLNPIGAPIAHAGMHVAVVVHASDTDLFLPPHYEQ